MDAIKMNTPKAVLEALMETGMRESQAHEVAEAYERVNGKTLGISHINERWQSIKANKSVRNATAVLISDLSSEKKTNHLAPERGVMYHDGKAYISDDLPAWMQRESDIAALAEQKLAKAREALLQGKKLEDWVAKLIDDCNRHPDMSMVSVAWVMQDRGVIQ